MDNITENNKNDACFQERPLNTPTKLNFGTSGSQHINLSINNHQNVEYLHLKHFLDSDDEVTGSGNIVSKNSSRCNSPDSTTTGTFNNL